MALNFLQMLQNGFAPGNIFGPEQTASNMLMAPIVNATGVQNMLMTRPDPKNAPIIGSDGGFRATSPGHPAVDPQMTAAVTGPAPMPIPETAQTVADSGAKPGLLGGYNAFRDSDGGARLNDFFVGMAMGKTPQESISLGAASASQGNRERTGRNETVEWLKGKGVDAASAKQLASNPTALGDYIKGIYGQKSQQLLNVSKGSSIYDQTTGQWITPPPGADGAGGGEYGLSPIYGVDENGNTVIGQVGKDGSFHQVQTNGFKPVGSTTQQNLGTSYATRDRAGNIIATAPIDNAGAAQDKKFGTDSGEQQANKIPAGAALGSTLSGLDRLDGSVDQLLNDPALGKLTGWDTWVPNRPGGPTATAQAKLETLKSQVGFNVLQAMREASKTGGALGAISDKENTLLQNNLASLSQAQSDEEMRKQLGLIKNYVREAKGRLSGAYKQMYGEDYGVPLAPGNEGDIQAARDAISKGADRVKVIDRLRSAGIDPTGL